MGQGDSVTRADSDHSQVRKGVLNLWKREYDRVKPVDGLENLLQVDCPAFTCGNQSEALDYLMLVKDLKHCLTKSVLSSLSAHANPKRVIMIISGACDSEDVEDLAILSKLEGRLECVEGDQVLPEISRQNITDWLDSRFKHQIEDDTLAHFVVDNSRLKSRSPGLGYHTNKNLVAETGFQEYAFWGTEVSGVDDGDGWVRVQGKKAPHLPKKVDGVPVLTEVSNVKYSKIKKDMAENFHKQFMKLAVAEIASQLGLSKHYVFWEPDSVLLRDFCPFNAKGQVNLMKALGNDDRQCNAHHGSAFSQATGLQYKLTNPNQPPFSSRHMVVNQSSMMDFLSTVRARSNSTNAASHWSTSLLKAACPSLSACRCGFSEVGSYGSWMHRMNPLSVAEVINQEGNFVPKKGTCCPAQNKFTKENVQGLLSVQFERPSDPDCRTTLDN